MSATRTSSGALLALGLAACDPAPQNQIDRFAITGTAPFCKVMVTESYAKGEPVMCSFLSIEHCELTVAQEQERAGHRTIPIACVPNPLKK
jgi:hypothetical protein